MAIWFQIAIALNIIYWAIFFYLLARRRWNVPALAAGLFHMLFAGIVSVAPIRSLLDPDYPGYSLGLIHLEKRAVVIPAALILGWALASAWIAVGKSRGRWMRLVMVGDIFFAFSLGVSIVFDDAQNWKFQLGENFTATGITGLLILLGLFTLPFIASAIWAASRTEAGGPPRPVAVNSQERSDNSEQDANKGNGFRYSEIHV
ncbi:MAG TPA: hypothetical protein VIT88_00825 [Pyrinomonadaceae bacterium]